MDTLRIRTVGGLVDVPCRMVDSFTFEVFIPSRGLRKFTAFLNSRNVAKAEISDVTLASPEMDPRLGASMGVYGLDADEQERADEAAGDIMERFYGLIGIAIARPEPTFGNLTLEPLALAFDSEVKSHMALNAAWTSLHGAKSAYPQQDPRTAETPAGYVSRAAQMLATYMERLLDRCVLEQQAKAKMAEAAHRAGDDFRESGSESGFSGRMLDSATLATLMVGAP